MHGHDGTDPGELIRFGTIATVDLAGGRCTVAAGELTSGPIRWLAARAGATRAWSPPTIGEQVVLLCPDGELAGAIALLGVSSTANAPPGNTLRELVTFADGAVLAYDPQAHALEAILPAGATARIVADGGITLEGDVAVKGKLNVSETIDAEQDVTGAGISLQHHTHGQVKAGTDSTGEPQ
jgi:phage baseplate assembly protein V